MALSLAVVALALAMAYRARPNIKVLLLAGISVAVPEEDEEVLKGLQEEEWFSLVAVNYGRAAVEVAALQLSFEVRDGARVVQGEIELPPPQHGIGLPYRLERKTLLMRRYAQKGILEALRSAGYTEGGPYAVTCLDLEANAL